MFKILGLGVMSSAQDPFYIVKEEIQDSVSAQLMKIDK